MCPYMEWFENKPPKCKPKNDLCMMCIIGNRKRLEEIENENSRNSKVKQ